MNKNTVKTSLSEQSVWFRKLSESEKNTLIECAVCIEIPAKQRLFARGEEFDGVYAVLEGVLWVSGVDKEGNEVGLTLLEAGQWFGELALFDGLDRTHDVTALNDTLLLKLSRTALNSLLNASPQWWHHFGYLLASKARLLMESIEDYHLSSSMERLTKRLSSFYRQRQDAASASSIEIPLSQEQLAQLLGLSRQKINSLLKTLEQDGVVTLSYGRITLNRNALDLNNTMSSR